MHSFASVFIAAALATFSSAAPVGLPVSPTVSVSVSLPTDLPSVPLPPFVTEGEVESITEAVRAREANSQIPDSVKPIESEVPDIRARAATPSVPTIFTDISIEIQPYTEQLVYLVPSNCTITEITNIVSSIKAPISAAVPQLQALVGLEASAILAPVNAVAGDAELTVSEVASIVGDDVKLIFSAVGNVLNVTNANGGDIVAGVKDVLTNLGSAVTSLIGAVTPLVNGLSTSLAPVVEPVQSVISDLNLGELAVLLDLSI